LSNVVIKSGDIRWVDNLQGRSAVFAKIAFKGDGKGGKPKKEAAVKKTAVLQTEMEQKVKTAEKAAHAKGLSEGLKEGADQERAKLRTAAVALSGAIKELSILKKEILEKAEKEMVNLAFRVAEKVIHQEVSTGREVVLSVLRAAMKDILDREGLKIRMNPVDYHHLIENDPEGIQSIEGLRNAVIEADETVGPGGVVIETLFGEVDARLDRQMDGIREALLIHDPD
jgi:flagellar assembly protein FliH